MIDRGVRRLGPRQRHLPGIDGETDSSLRLIGREGAAAGVEHDLGQAIRARSGDPVQEVRTREARHEPVRRRREQLGRRAQLEDPSLDDHAHPVGERGRVLEVVRDEERRQPQLGEELGELAANDPARVGVERRERLVEQQHRRVARERPRQRDPLALAAGEVAGTGAGEVRDPEALEQLVHSRAAAEGDVAADVEMREERVLLEDEPDGPPLGRQIDAGVAVEPGGRSKRDLPLLRP